MNDIDECKLDAELDEIVNAMEETLDSINAAFKELKRIMGKNDVHSDNIFRSFCEQVGV